MRKSRENQILIMCGGRGKRLGHLTHKVPKPLIRIGDKTILELKIQNYSRQGFKDFIICVGYKASIIKKAVRKFDFPCRYRFSDIGEPAGILKRLHAARGMLDERVLLTYGDTYTKLDLRQFSDAHAKSQDEATIVAAPIQNPFGLIEFDKNNKVTLFREKPVLNYYIGYAIINKTALSLIPQKVINMPDGDGLITFYKILAAMGKLGVFYYTGPQITFNTEDELEIARGKILSFYTTKE